MTEYNVDDRVAWFHIFTIAFISLLYEPRHVLTGQILIHSVGCMPERFHTVITELIE